MVELRRAEDGIRYRDEEPGEYYLEFTDEYGGLWRRLATSPQALCGFGTVAVGFNVSGYYVRNAGSFDNRAAFIFKGIGDDEVIGNFGYFAGGASGTEIDATDPMLGTPPHTLILASSESTQPGPIWCPTRPAFIMEPRTVFRTPGYAPK